MVAERVRSWLSGLGLVAAGALVIALRLRLGADPVLPPVRVLPAGWSVLFAGENLMALAVQAELVWTGGPAGLHAVHRARGAPVALPGEPELRLVRDIEVDDAGRTWVAHGAGVSVRAGRAWTTVLAGEGRALAVRGARVVAATEAGVFDCAAAPVALHPRPADALWLDRAGALWVGVSSPTAPGLLRLAGAEARVFGAADGLPHPSVQDITEGRDGALRVATGALTRGGLARLEIPGQIFTSIGKADGLAADQVRSVHEDRAGWLWVGSESSGCAVHDGRRWRILTPAHGLPAWEVKQVTEDREGRMWLATAAGLVRIEDHRAVERAFERPP